MSVSRRLLRRALFIQNLGDENVYPIPKIELFLSDLVELAQAPELAEVGLEGMREDLVMREDAPLLIKPALDGCSTGVMRLQHPGDLVAYATAIAQEWDEIPIELTPGALLGSVSCTLRPLQCIQLHWPVRTPAAAGAVAKRTGMGIGIPFVLGSSQRLCAWPCQPRCVSPRPARPAAMLQSITRRGHGDLRGCCGV